MGQPVEVRVFSTAPKKPASAGFFFFRQLVSLEFRGTENPTGMNYSHFRRCPAFYLSAGALQFDSGKLWACRRPHRAFPGLASNNIRSGTVFLMVSITNAIRVAIHDLIHPPPASAIWAFPGLASCQNDGCGQQSKSKGGSQHIELLRNGISGHVGAGWLFCDVSSEFIVASRPITEFEHQEISVDIDARCGSRVVYPAKTRGGILEV